MTTTRAMILSLAFLAIVGCGGGGGSDGSGPGGAVSGRVPYLLSKPIATFASSTWDNTHYDVTVTVEADGPTGVQFADVFLRDDTGTNFAFIDLDHITGTKQWRGATNTFVPLPAGNYRVEEIMLHDGDPLNADPRRTGWYIYDEFFSTSVYFVDERELSGVNILYFNWGLSAIPVTRVTLP